MPNPQNTGNSVNVANFQTLLSYCIAFGESYNPAKEALKVANLQSLLNDARDVLASVHTLETAYDNAVDARKKIFSDLRPLSTKVYGAFSLSDVDEIVVNGAKSIYRKIQGQRASAKPEAVIVDGVATNPKTRSASQQSFDDLIEHFDALISLVSSHSTYSPNEVAIQVPTLKSYLTALRNANLAVTNTHTDINLERGKRNTILYSPKTGLVDIALDVKTYIRITYGMNSVEYNNVKGISFRNVK